MTILVNAAELHRIRVSARIPGSAVCALAKVSRPRLSGIERGTISAREDELKPLVSKETWERVQSLLDGKSHGRIAKHSFTFSGLLTCGHCGCSMVAEIKKGRYVYYHCTGGKGTKCPEPYTREERLSSELTTVLRELVVPKPITDWLRVAFAQSDVTETRARQQALQIAQQEFDRIGHRIEAMYLDKLDGRVSASFFDEKAAQWREEQIKLQRRISDLKTAGSSFDQALCAIKQTSALYKTFPSQQPSEQRRLLTILVERATWKEGRLDTLLKTPFQKLRLSNSVSYRKEMGKEAMGDKIEEWLPDMDSNHDSRLQRPLSYR